MDVKYLERIPGTRCRLYQFTAIGDCTRIRVLKIYDRCNQATAIQFIEGRSVTGMMGSYRRSAPAFELRQATAVNGKWG